MAILVTGGLGYIGSHVCVELLEAGYEVVVIDNQANSDPSVLTRVEEITEKEVRAYSVDLMDRPNVEMVFKENEIEAVIHIAGLKAVAESIEQPLKYYRVNLLSTITLCEVMEKFAVHRLVFSSSATVYGMPERVPIREDSPLEALNPYGRTKMMIEEMLTDLHRSNPNWSISMLRYFNPIGAHKSGLIGEAPEGTPANLVPYVTEVASGKREQLFVFGNDYPTEDGTCIRDYLHIVDLAQGHVLALRKIERLTGIDVYNLGTGQGYSVLDIITAFEQVLQKEIPYEVVERRPGDAPVSYADPTKAKQELGWVAQRELLEMCEDAWNWQVHRLQLENEQ